MVLGYIFQVLASTCERIQGRDTDNGEQKARFVASKGKACPRGVSVGTLKREKLQSTRFDDTSILSEDTDGDVWANLD